MENVISFECIDEANSIFTTESCEMNTIMEITDKELDQPGVNVDANKQQNMDISSDWLEKEEVKRQGLFGPFSHHMRPDLELIRLQSEQSALNQEAATKLINDRYKWIMENAARRKAKEQKNSIKSTQISHNLDCEKIMKTTQLSHYAGIENIKKTTQLLHNMHLTPGFLTKDESEAFSDNHLEKIYWHGVLDRFIKSNYVEINAKTNIPSMDVLNTVTVHPEYRVEDALRDMSNEQKETEKTITFTQVSQKLDRAKCKKTTQSFFDGHKAIESSFEELLDESFEIHWEL